MPQFHSNATTALWRWCCGQNMTLKPTMSPMGARLTKDWCIIKVYNTCMIIPSLTGQECSFLGFFFCNPLVRNQKEKKIWKSFRMADLYTQSYATTSLASLTPMDWQGQSEGVTCRAMALVPMCFVLIYIGTWKKKEDLWSCIAHLNAEDMLKSLFRKRSLNIALGQGQTTH